jgi:SAM-dependent methyltransferase
MTNTFQERLDSAQLAVRRISTFAEFKAYVNAAATMHSTRRLYMKMFGQHAHSFVVPGYCFVCGDNVEFLMRLPVGVGGQPPNWREGLTCPRCHFNGRTRAAMHIFHQECLPSQDSVIYMTEQVTSAFGFIRKNYPLAIGSEYLGDEIPFGQVNSNGVRNESVVRLTFEDNAFDFALSFDVMEHVPDYRKGFAECYRCLKPGGRLLFSVPFIQQNKATLVRATVGADGSVTHLLPPEYHGDPINSNGCLCFYHFGWDMLENLRELGFETAEALLYWSAHCGYLGNADQIMFLARKPYGASE